MVPIIEAAGGRVLHGAEVAEVLVEDDAVQGVQLASGEVVRCPRVVSNAGVLAPTEKWLRFASAPTPNGHFRRASR